MSNDGRRTKTIGSPTTIVSRSITRSSKPPSLKLLGSNGATALVSTPLAPQAPAKDRRPSTTTTIQQSLDERPLPPPPPEKSIRRKSIKKPGATMGNIASKLDRRDSKEPEKSVDAKDEQRSSQTSQTSQASQATKRKPLPGSNLMKKFPSLADLKNGPRGRKPSTTSTERDSVSSRKSSQDSTQTITPASQAAAYRKASVSRSPAEEATSRTALSGHRPNLSKSSQLSGLPPTPDDLPTEKIAPPPPVPRKVYVGLPSNPRARRQEPQPSVKHVRGKSSTSFDMVKVCLAFPAPAHIQNSRRGELRILVLMKRSRREY